MERMRTRVLLVVLVLALEGTQGLRLMEQQIVVVAAVGIGRLVPLGRVMVEVELLF
jgi:hypothetical protein